MSEKIINIKPEKCVGCHHCEMACATAHSQSKVLIEAINEEKKPVSRIKVHGRPEINLPIQCRHCKIPFCAESCPKDALKVENGIVYLQEDLCINCLICMKVCPYGAIKGHKDMDVIYKCDFCRERKEGPACVEACPTGCLTLVDSDNIKENDFINNNFSNSYLYPDGKISVVEEKRKSDSSSEKIEQKDVCQDCGTKIIPLKQVKEASEKVENKDLKELFNLGWECRSKHILNKLKG